MTCPSIGAVFDFQFSVVEYLGKLENGVLVIIGINYKKGYFEGTFFYTDKDMVFTISDDLKSVVGEIKDHPQYLEFIRKILRLVVPYNEIYNSIDQVNFKGWVSRVAELEGLELPNVDGEYESEDGSRT